MGAKLIRNGHRDILQYRMNFFQICLTELNDTISDNMRYNAIAHKMSRLDGKEFENMMRDETPTGDRVPIVVDHEAQMRQAQG